MEIFPYRYRNVSLRVANVVIFVKTQNMFEKRAFLHFKHSFLCRIPLFSLLPLEILFFQSYRNVLCVVLCCAVDWSYLKFEKLVKVLLFFHFLFIFRWVCWKACLCWNEQSSRTWVGGGIGRWCNVMWKNSFLWWCNCVKTETVLHLKTSNISSRSRVLLKRRKTQIGEKKRIARWKKSGN